MRLHETSWWAHLTFISGLMRSPFRQPYIPGIAKRRLHLFFSPSVPFPSFRLSLLFFQSFPFLVQIMAIIDITRALERRDNSAGSQAGVSEPLPTSVKALAGFIVVMGLIILGKDLLRFHRCIFLTSN